MRPGKSPPQNYDIMRRYDHLFFFDHYTLPYYAIMLFNTARAPFDDLRVRTALSLAVDRDYIVQHILRGYGKPAAGPMGIGSPFHNPAVQPTPYNPQKARALLHASGWAPDKNGWLKKQGRTLAFTLLVPAERPVTQQVARLSSTGHERFGCTGKAATATIQENHPTLLWKHRLSSGAHRVKRNSPQSGPV